VQYASLIAIATNYVSLGSTCLCGLTIGVSSSLWHIVFLVPNSS